MLYKGHCAVLVKRFRQGSLESSELEDAATVWQMPVPFWEDRSGKD